METQLLIWGIAFLTIGLSINVYQSKIFYTLYKSTKDRTYLGMIYILFLVMILILFFIVGYGIIYLNHINQLSLSTISPFLEKNLVLLILFFGSIFVFIINFSFYLILNKLFSISYSNDFLEKIFNTLPTFVVLTDQEDKIININDSFLAKFQLKKDNLLGKKLSDIMKIHCDVQNNEVEYFILEINGIKAYIDFTIQDINLLNKTYKFFCFNNITPLVNLQKKIQKEKQILQRFFSPKIIEQIFEDQSNDQIENQLQYIKGTKTERIIVFIDLRNSTNLSLNTEPHEFATILNRFAHMVCDYVLKCGGIVHKILGDGILITLEKNQANILPYCFKNIFVQFKKDPLLQEQSFGITCHYGNVFMGYIGSEHLIDYTVLGEAVNITFKLQELAKKLSYPIIITEDVMNLFSPEKDFNNFVIKKFNNIYLKKYNVSFNIFGLEPMNLESKEVTDYGSCSLPSKDNSLR
jgi:class 3 adenylate cyclase/PAS domain-containing protein